MRLSFSYLLLITWFAVAISCKTNYVPTSYNAQNISVSTNAHSTDSQLIQMYLPYKKNLEKDMQRIICTSEKEMFKGRPESYLTNFLADMLLAEAKNEAKNSELKINTDISYFNYGGIRTFLPEGEITMGKIFELMPFENELVFIQLSGEQIQEFLNHLAEKGGESVGGIRYVISNGKAINIQINGTTMISDEKYWLATNDYVAEGGDGLEVFTHRSEIIRPGKKIRTLIIDYFKKSNKNGKKLNAELDGRVKNG
jgi:2',3'-cyclic-nucleotide 2'-phosphodiesterase (5'-nucleotidase family)